MPSRPAAALDELADEFDVLGDGWEERWQYVMDLGRRLPPLTEAEHSDENRVRGCASQVWLVSDPVREGGLIFRGDSDSPMTKGLVALVIRLLSGADAAEITAFDAQAAFARLGFDKALSAQRANGLASMVARIRREAAAV